MSQLSRQISEQFQGRIDRVQLRYSVREAAPRDYQMRQQYHRSTR
jgi:hypothetical protein